MTRRAWLKTAVLLAGIFVAGVVFGVRREPPPARWPSTVNCDARTTAADGLVAHEAWRVLWDAEPVGDAGAQLDVSARHKLLRLGNSYGTTITACAIDSAVAELEFLLAPMPDDLPPNPVFRSEDKRRRQAAERGRQFLRDVGVRVVGEGRPQ